MGTCCRLAVRRPEVHTAVPSPARLPEGRHSLARLVQKASRGALAAHEDVLLQRLLMEHPVAHTEGRVTCRKAKGQCGLACLKSSTGPITSLHFITHWEQSRFPSILLGLLLKITISGHFIPSLKSHHMFLLLNLDMSPRAAVQSGFGFASSHPVPRTTVFSHSRGRHGRAGELSFPG